MSFPQDALKMLLMIGRQGPVSRTKLSKELGFTPSRISRLSDQLLHTGLIHEQGHEKSTGGRRSSLLSLREDTHVLCGVQISIDAEVEVVLMDLRANILEREQFTEDQKTRPQLLVHHIAAAMRRCFERSPSLAERLIAVGVGISGLVLADQGLLLRSRAFPHWRNVPLSKLLSTELGLPTFVENEVAMSTGAELWFGKGRHCRNFLYVNLGAGVRMGMVIDGNLYRGVTGNAGELGHTTYEENGPVCHCGNVGCLERYVSTETLLQWAREALRSYSDSRLADLCRNRPEALNLEHIFTAAREGDRLSRTLLRRVCTPIGRTVASLINIFDTEKILIGGSLAGGGELLLQYIEEQIELDAFPFLRENTRVELAELKRHHTAIGGGALILEKICEGQLEIKNH